MDTGYLARLVDLAREEALRLRHPYIRTEHLLLAALKIPESDAYRILNDSGIHYDAVAALVAALPCPVCAAEARLELSAGAKRALDWAMGQDAATTNHLLIGLLRYSQVNQHMLYRLGIDYRYLEMQLAE